MSKLTRLPAACAVAILIGVVPIPANAQAPIADAFKDFSSTVNPNGQWTYGYTQTQGSTLIPYVNKSSVFPRLGCAGFSGWYQDIGLGDPLVIANTTGAVATCGSGITAPPDVLLLHPGPNGENSVVRWTAVGPGDLAVQGQFEGADNTTTDVHILLNSSTVLFSGNVNGQGSTQPFQVRVHVNTGDRIDFSVGFGSNGNFYNDSTTLSATIGTTFTPDLVSPPNGGVTDSTSPTVQWMSVAGASQYQVYLGSTSTNLSLYATVNAPTLTATLANLNAGSRYYWKVVALVGGVPASSLVWSFITPGQAQAPTLSWPLNNTTSTGTTFTLQWAEGAGAVQYQVYLGTSATSLSMYTTVNAPGLTAPVYSLNPGVRYYWKVVAINGGTSASSLVWSFTTPGALPGPNVVWPLNGSTSDSTTFTLKWTPVAGASQYQVYFGSTSTNLPLFATVNAPAVTTALYNLNAGTTYYWQVSALVSNQTMAGGVWSFITPGQAQAPYVVWPLNGSTSEGTSLNLQWTPVPGASQYQVYFGPNSASLPLYETVAAPTVRAAVNGLNAGTAYYWKVVAIVGSTLAASGLWSFTTPGGSPTLSQPQVVWPLNGALGQATTLTVQWSPVPGATQYQIYFGDNPSKLALYATVKAPTVKGAFYHLTDGVTYYWQVVAIALGQSATGPVSSFTTL